jgi:hypothetical protein
MSLKTKAQNAKNNRAYRLRQRQKVLDLEAENLLLRDQNRALGVALAQARAGSDVAWDTLKELVVLIGKYQETGLTQ